MLFRKIAKAFAKDCTKAIYLHDVTFVAPVAMALHKKRYRLRSESDLSRADDLKVKE
jgi:hypothetical protein